MRMAGSDRGALNVEKATVGAVMENEARIATVTSTLNGLHVYLGCLGHFSDQVGCTTNLGP
jgi:hypothetical protein